MKQELTPGMIEGLEERFGHAVIAYVDADGYPMSVATEFKVDPGRAAVLLEAVAGPAQPPTDERVNLVFSHIRPQPGIGYDERRYVSLWGPLRSTGAGLEFTPERVQHWDEKEMSFFEYSERSVPQAHRYLEQVSSETGRTVRPKLSFGWLFLRATRLPFLTATFVPILLGLAVAAWRDGFSWWAAVATLVGGACIHLGLNVANDVFDTTSGADEANVNPTQFSGGSRVVHYGLLSLRQIALLSAGFYAAGIAIGLVLAATRGWDLLWLGVAGALLSFFYTAPPLKLVHRGLGEIVVALGFGPIMALGAYYVQAGRYDLEPLLVSIPVGILIALVLYVNEVPDRPADAAAGKRTLPVRLPKDVVVNGYAAAVAVSFGLIVVFALAGWIVRPAIIAVAAAPLALPVYRALKEHYDQPYALMPAMAKNIQLHLATGLLLLAGYLIALIADGTMDDPPSFLT
ncbi:MAG TPA: prenyltransferase [Gaiellaceae bacterium]